MSQSTFPTSPYCTIGPFFPREFVTGCEDLTSLEGRPAQGEHILLAGRVVEEGNRPILNAIVEIWQPDANGVFRHPLDPRFLDADPNFLGWGRARTDAEGRYSFRTVMPGAYRTEDGDLRCPHLNLMLLAIGLTRRLVTTVFFGDSAKPPRDPVLDSIPEPAQRARLFATLEPGGNGAARTPVYRFDIVTRGESETPFFED
jgi:protocatechuate 3,4-dioxygenase alpha subunit